MSVFYPTYDQVLRSKFGGLVIPVTELGADPTGTEVSTGAISEAAAYASSRAGGGIVWLGAGVFAAQGLPLYSNVRYMGAGQGATTLQLPASATNHLFYQVVPSGGALVNSGISDMTLSANGNTGYLYGVLLDASANVDIVEEDNVFERLTFKGFAIGWYHGADNTDGGPMYWKKTYVDHCSFYDCQFGIGHRGTYGDTYSHIFTSRCTLAGISTYGAQFSPLQSNYGGPTPGGDPATMTNLSHIHVEGLGDYASGTDNGVTMNSSALNADGLEISNVSMLAASLANPEPNIQCNIRGITSWGCGGGVALYGGSTGQCGTLEGLELSNVGNNTANWPGGYAPRQYPLFILGGHWQVKNGMVTYPPGATPAYNVELGTGAGSVGQFELGGVSFPTAGTSFISVADTSAVVRISDCPGYNPTGLQTAPAVPASGTALTNPFPFDCTVAVTDTSTGTSVAVGGITVATVPSGNTVPVFVAAGQTITLTYTTAPTWAWTGH